MPTAANMDINDISAVALERERGMSAFLAQQIASAERHLAHEQARVDRLHVDLGNLRAQKARCDAEVARLTTT